MHLNSTVLNYGGMKHKNRPSLYNERDYRRVTFLLFSLFAQGAYGNPGLDILKDKFRTYYLVGARFTWNFGSLYTLKNDRKNLDNRIQQIRNERDLFLFNTHLQLAEEDGTIQSSSPAK